MDADPSEADERGAPLGARIRALVAAAPLPDPGTGSTGARFAGLTEVSRGSLSLGRLFEGHADAVTILHEAGMTPPSGVGAVWASEDPGHPLVAGRHRDGLVVDGRKPFCSGAALVDWALVTARVGDEVVLGLLPLDRVGVSVAPAEWVGPGMIGADTRTVCFAGTPLVAVVGGPRWYLERPGFWHGAIGVAACWWGGALGVLGTMRSGVRDEPHAMALLGEAEAEGEAMSAVLARAAEEIDRDPQQPVAARRRALLVRAVVEQGSRRILDHAALALGPRPLALDRAHSQRVADLQDYLRQHHGRRDLEALGRATREHSLGARSEPVSC